MEFSPEELEMMSSNWVQEKPKWNGVTPKSIEECVAIQKILPPEEYKKVYDAWWKEYGEQEHKQKLEEIKLRQIEREERQEAKLQEERQKKEREDKELEELIYQSWKKEKDSKPAIVEPVNDEKPKYEQQAKEILQNLLKEKNALVPTANKLYNQLINLNNTQPSETKIAQVALAHQQLKEIREMSWRQALLRK